MSGMRMLLGRELSWFWFVVGSWRRCHGGGRDGDQKAVWPCRGGQGVVPGWGLEVEECWGSLGG